MSDEFFRRKNAGDYLQEKYGFGSWRTLSKLATVGGGPRYHKAGSAAVYKRSDLDAWALEKMGEAVASTSAYDTKRKRKTTTAAKAQATA